MVHAVDFKGKWAAQRAFYRQKGQLAQREVLRYNDALLQTQCGMKSRLACEEGTGVAAEEMK